MPRYIKTSRIGNQALNHIVPTNVFPIERNHIELKSLNYPPVSQKVMGYSLKLAPTRRRRKAVLKNWTRNVTVVVFDRRSVSVLKPTQLINMMQTVRRMKLIPVRT